MHETMKRLYEAALLLKGVAGQSDVARLLGESPQTVKNWESRGVSKGGMIKAQMNIGCSPVWIERGTGSMANDLPQDMPMFSRKINNETLSNYPRVVGTARCGDKGYYLDLDGGDGYLEFEAEPGSIAIKIRGDSMYPAIKDGWFVIIEPSGKPAIDEYILLKFKDGRKMVKTLLQQKADCFIVESVNGGERITAMMDDLEGYNAVGAVIPPSKHREWVA